MAYKILHHTADSKFQAKGDTLEEAFTEAVNAFSQIIGGEEGMYTHNIEIESENLEALLFDFLDKIIFIQDTNDVVVGTAKNIEINEQEEITDGFKLKGEILVDKITDDMSPLDVKAPTYNEMKVERENNKWVLEAVLDI